MLFEDVTEISLGREPYGVGDLGNRHVFMDE